MPGDRVDQDRLRGATSVPGRGCPAQLRAITELRAVAEDERPGETARGADADIPPDPAAPRWLVSSRMRRVPRHGHAGGQPRPSTCRSQLAAQRVEGALASSPSDPTSFQYSSTSWMWKGRRSRAASGRHPGPSPRRGARGSSRRSRVEDVDAAVAEVGECLLRAGLLLKAGDPPVAVMQDDAELGGVGDPLDRERGDPAGLHGGRPARLDRCR